jgi:hypothetical protein
MLLMDSGLGRVRRARELRARVLYAVVLLGGACSDDATVIANGANPPDGETMAPGVHSEPATAAYALVTLVWSDEGPTGYVALTDSLDVGNVSLERAREFPGYTSIGVAGGQLLVSPSAEDPTIERYAIGADLSWQAGEVLSFLNQGVAEVGFYRQYMTRERAAYVDVDVSGRVLWDPLELVIRETRPETSLPLERDGLVLYPNFNRTQLIFDEAIVRPFSYHDEDWLRWSPTTALLVYDATTHELTRQVDAPCPALDSITRDEAGNTYLGTWEYSALFPLMGLGAAPCVARLAPDGAIDSGWNPDLTSMTGGRQIVNFRYVGGGRAIAAVLHAEEYGPGFDFSRFAENIDELWASAARYHRLWMIDLVTGTAAPVRGIDAFEWINPGFFHAVIDGRVFVFLGDGSTNDPPSSVVYELDPSGQATRRFESPGSITQWVKIR